MSNTNESDTIRILQNFLELNKAKVGVDKEHSYSDTHTLTHSTFLHTKSNGVDLISTNELRQATNGVSVSY